MPDLKHPVPPPVAKPIPPAPPAPTPAPMIAHPPPAVQAAVDKAIAEAAKPKKVKKPKAEKPAAPPKPTLWGHPISGVARALGQKTEAKAKDIAAFVVSKGFKDAEDTAMRQSLRGRRCLDPAYAGAGDGGYFKLGPVPELTVDNLAEFNAFIKTLPPPPVKVAKVKKVKKAAEPPAPAGVSAPAAAAAAATPPAIPTK